MLVTRRSNQDQPQSVQDGRPRTPAQTIKLKHTHHANIPCIGGISLLELLVVIAILGILLTVAVPSMHAMLMRNHLKAAAQSIAEDLQWTRSEAIKRNQRLRVSFDPNEWCYGIDIADTGDCDCRLPPEQDGACSLKRRSGADFTGIRLAASFKATSFEPRRGTCNNGNLTLTAANGSTLRVVLSRLSRVRICSPSNDVPGYGACGD
jgi:type IV fimbrial biogenesis protein FimT